MPQLGFRIGKQDTLINIPKGATEVSYSLIKPFSAVKIHWDGKAKEYIYELTEPELSEGDEKLYDRITQALLELLDVELSSIKKREDVIEYIQEKVLKIIEEYELIVSQESFDKIMYYIYRNFVGLNQIEAVMNDPYIEDISCNGIDVPLYIVHRRFGAIKTNMIFTDQKELTQFIVKLAVRCGRFISYAEPLLDGTLPDGSRVQASFSKDITTHGPTFTIRRFVEEPLSPVNLLEANTLNSEMLAYLWLAVENGASILIAGGTSTGKTTLLNVLTMFIRPASKIISVEDTRELNLQHENWIPAVTRSAFAKGYGEVTLFDLLKESFRQSPDYVVVGEVRGQEAYVMFQGMASGMPALGTMHAGKVEDVIHRLQSPPINLAPTLLETLDVIVLMTHARQYGESSRRVKEIDEIESVDPKTYTARTNTAFTWVASNDSFEYRGYSWLLQKISVSHGVPLESLQRELNNRKNFIDLLFKKNLKSFNEVSGKIAEYYKDPMAAYESLRRPR